MLNKSVFIKAYCRLDGLEQLSESDWNDLLRVLRAYSLTASYYRRLCKEGMEYQLPDYCRNAFVSAAVFAEAQAHQTRIQALKICRLSDDYHIPIIFLKGAAYTLGQKENSIGRLMSDIDICVARDKISQLEAALLESGWTFKDIDEHDDKYYRAWSHELPPLKHDQDGVVLDVHHTLLPPIKRRLLNINDLLNSTVDKDTFPVPSMEWLVLHSALHLILNEDVDNGLRDLTDIYLLLNGDNCECGSLRENLLKAEALFEREGFKTEWFILTELLVHYFALPINRDVKSKLSVHAKIRLHCLKSAILPNFPFMKSAKDNFLSFVNYLLGYQSKMPISILLHQASYKLYRFAVKLVFGEYYFRKKKGIKEQ
ncbi:MAG: nucleotidyltransferase family protein [Pseudomonadota bacterium]|nr:nucleotidyltransferase family protein [Pseudomonadota bacterium]|tara:strand:+ start:644 stop:1753 length:1110 start_codon:yes stop_codon:yes gene_type:complete